MTPTFYTLAELAARWAVSQKTVNRRIALREIPCVKIGNCVRIPAQGVEAYEQSKTVHAK